MQIFFKIFSCIERKRRKKNFIIYFAFLTSSLTYTWHFGQWTLTGLRLLDRLARRFPMYVHWWLHLWHVTRQLEYWESMTFLKTISACIKAMQAKGESKNKWAERAGDLFRSSGYDCDIPRIDRWWGSCDCFCWYVWVVAINANPGCGCSCCDVSVWDLVA